MQLYSNKHSNSQSKKKSKRALRNRGETHPITSNNTVTSHLHPVSPYISPTHIQKQDRQRMYSVTLRRVRATTVAVEKQEVWRILSVCLSPSLSSMQRACAILSYVACPALQYFSTLSHKRHGFRGKKLLNIKMCFWYSLQLLSETFLILRRNERDIIIQAHRYSCKVPVILARF